MTNGLVRLTGEAGGTNDIRGRHSTIPSLRYPGLPYSIRPFPLLSVRVGMEEAVGFFQAMSQHQFFIAQNLAVFALGDDLAAIEHYDARA